MEGLYGKYIIQKADGTAMDPSADYFVLRLDKDPIARQAALTYAMLIREQNAQLAVEIYMRVMEYERPKRKIKSAKRKEVDDIEGQILMF